MCLSKRFYLGQGVANKVEPDFGDLTSAIFYRGNALLSQGDAPQVHIDFPTSSAVCAT